MTTAEERQTETGFIAEILEAEADAIRRIRDRLLDQEAGAWQAALDLLERCEGHVVVCGMGKSGLIGAKVSATFSSLGQPSSVIHPAEAVHGDLGRLRSGDVVLLLSYSGETEEVVNLAAILKADDVPRIGVSCGPGTTLARLSTVHLALGNLTEACPLNLAPTASTTAALALGDALAVALLDARGFGHEDFARSHPGGQLGRRLLTHVRDVMRTGADIPSVNERATLAEAILEVSKKRMGMTAVVDDAHRLVGIFTDGDLRRSLERGGDLRATPIAAVMTRGPRTIRPEALAAEAVELMEARKTTQLPVVDAAGTLVGALNIHDLFRAKVL
jgi:arabinose-5-phosphate isomerase